jgi:hypothetical protein
MLAKSTPFILKNSTYNRLLELGAMGTHFNDITAHVLPLSPHKMKVMTIKYNNNNQAF